MKLKRRKIKRGRVEVIPMIDTVVILLIFYMTFSRFAEMSRESKIKLPESRAGKPEDTSGRGRITVNMFNSKEISVADYKNQKIEDLPGILLAYKAADKTITNWSVTLRANQEMTYQDLSRFMRACAKAKIVDVTFAAMELSK